MKNDHSSNFQFKQLERSLKKSGLQWDSNPWHLIGEYRCDVLPSELWSHTLGCPYLTFIYNRSSNMNYTYFMYMLWFKFTSSSNCFKPVYNFQTGSYFQIGSYVPVKSKLKHPPQATPCAFEFLENFCSNSPLLRPKSCSNTPLYNVSPFQLIKCPHPRGNFSVALEAVYVNMVYRQHRHVW